MVVDRQDHILVMIDEYSRKNLLEGEVHRKLHECIHQSSMVTKKRSDKMSNCQERSISEQSV